VIKNLRHKNSIGLNDVISINALIETDENIKVSKIANTNTTGHNSKVIHRATVAYFCPVSMPVDFCRHLVGKNLRNVCHCDRA